MASLPQCSCYLVNSKRHRILIFSVHGLKDQKNWLLALSFRVLVLTCQRVLLWAPFFFTQGPSSAAISQNHHLYLGPLFLLLPGASWLESHALLCQSPPCYADFLARLHLELPGVAGYWSQKLQCAAKGTWLPWVFLSRGGLPGMWSHVLSHLQATSLFQLEKKNVDPWNSFIKLLLLGKDPACG